MEEDAIKKEYELAVMVDGGAAEKEVDEFLASPAQKAEIAGREPARLTELAYPIKKRTSATMLVYYLRLFPESVAAIKKGLSFQPHVLRSLLISKQTATEDKKRVAGVEGIAPVVQKPGVEISSTEELAKTLEELEK